MKKILLSAMFMSLISLSVLTEHSRLHHQNYDQQMNEVSFFGMNCPEGTREIRDVRMDVKNHETVGDFVKHLRRTINPETGWRYVEGKVKHVLFNGENISLDTTFESLNIQPEDSFWIIYDYQAN